MDIIITIALIYFAYRGYRWYTAMQQQVQGGDAPRNISADADPVHNPTVVMTGDEDDYIEYEEITDEDDD